jgi:hypothetical protein
MYHLSGLGKLSLSITLMQHDSPGTDYQGLTRLLQRCPNLTDLHLSFEPHYSVPMYLRRGLHGWLGEDAVSCTSLRSLHLSRFRASEEAMSRIFLANPSLERLTLRSTSSSLSAVPPGSFPALRVLLTPAPSMIEQLVRIGAPELREIRHMDSIDAYALEHLEKLALRAPRLAILGWDRLESASDQVRAMELIITLSNSASYALPRSVSIVDEYGAACFKVGETALERVEMRLRHAEKKAAQLRTRKDKIETRLRRLSASGNPVDPLAETRVAGLNRELQSLDLNMSTLRSEEEMLRVASNSTD